MPLDDNLDITAGFSEYIRLNERGLMNERKLGEFIGDAEYSRSRDYSNKLILAILGYNLDLQISCEQVVR